MENNHTRAHFLGNLSGLLVISVVLLIAFYEQFFQHQLPCPLCLLQRAALAGVGIGFIFNLALHCKPAHYGLIILAAINGFVCAMRQILLHVAAGDTGFGTPLFGLHLYTWSALIFLAIIAYASFGLLFDKGFQKFKPNIYANMLIVLFLLIVTVDGVASFLECGLTGCPDNPVYYKLLGNI